jgi:hypothetical protein
MTKTPRTPYLHTITVSRTSVFKLMNTTASFSLHRAPCMPCLMADVVIYLSQIREDPFAPARPDRNLTLHYHSPPGMTFDLHAFSYACNSGIPQPECAIQVWGHKANGNIKYKVVTFPRLDPGHVIADFVMNRTHFGLGWSDLKSLGFSNTRADNGGIFGGLMLDNLEYTTKEKVCS